MAPKTTPTLSGRMDTLILSVAEMVGKLGKPHVKRASSSNQSDSSGFFANLKTPWYYSGLVSEEELIMRAVLGIVRDYWTEERSETEKVAEKQGRLGKISKFLKQAKSSNYSNIPVLHPMVEWAQRANLVFLTVCLEDCKNPEIKYDNEKLHFKGIGGRYKKDYELILNLYERVKGKQTKHIIRDRGIEFVFYKEEAIWWPRLLSENKKVHWLKVDSNKWMNEDGSGVDGNFNESSYENMMRTQGSGEAFGDFPPTPPVQWAQRTNLVFLTIGLVDCKNPEIKYDNEKLHFKGNGGTDKKDYELFLNFFATVKGYKTKHTIRDRGIEFVFYKEEAIWWPRLLSADKKKVHWLTVDFNKWKDEKDSDHV